jgi:hypothetical protein
MADEITASASLSFTKGGISADYEKLGLKITMSGSNYIQNILSVATSETALPKGSITTPGLCLVVNLDTTNFVKVRGASGAVDCIKIPAGELALFRHSGTSPYLIADTAACRVAYLLIEA